MLQHVACHTFHGRRGTVRNAFRYSVDYLLIDPEQDDARGPALFSRNRANLCSWQARDHGDQPGQGSGARWARDVLAGQGIDAPGQILLLTQPRLLGHVFNPVSFWLCHDQGGALVAVLAEVTNTFGDRHSYICTAPEGVITSDSEITAQKLMHVSPFQPVAGDYGFHFDITKDRIGIRIDYRREEGGLVATLAGTRAPLSNRAILRSALRRPFGARRVLALIHWQALVLWLKGARYRRRPEPPSSSYSHARKEALEQ
ncbi:MAG: DUF1365 domain-containing protein [Pelagimonas sp.]|jgi:DUF1365 family protein|nr:DUF1365 domain-containing protein [Pelagimonas sp.]